MTFRLFAGALYAGLAAGLVAAVLQFVFVIPLLVEGELFETGMRVHFQDGSVQSPAGSGGLEFDLVRHGLTVGMAIVSYTAFALLMSAGMAIAARRGEVITPRRGAVWGLAGFAAIALSPAAGLPPELPGTIGAELVARQVWWVAAMLFSVAGIALIAFARGPQAWALALAGLGLLLLPHLYGAPMIDRYYGISPPELSALFATRSLAVTAVAWVVMGAVAAHFRADPRPAG